MKRLIIIIGVLMLFVSGCNMWQSDIPKAFDFCNEQNYTMCSVGNGEILCGLNSCYLYEEGNLLCAYNQSTFELIECRRAD